MGVDMQEKCPEEPEKNAFQNVISKVVMAMSG